MPCQAGGLSFAPNLLSPAPAPPPPCTPHISLLFSLVGGVPNAPKQALDQRGQGCSDVPVVRYCGLDIISTDLSIDSSLSLEHRLLSLSLVLALSLSLSPSLALVLSLSLSRSLALSLSLARSLSFARIPSSLTPAPTPTSTRTGDAEFEQSLRSDYANCELRSFLVAF
jgi:hypothetical protein